MYLSLSNSHWTQDGQPDDSCFNFRKMFTYCAKSPPELAPLSPHIPKIQTRPLDHNHIYDFANLVHYSCSNYTPLLIRVGTAAFAHCFGTYRTQREQEFGIVFVQKNWKNSFLVGRNLHFIIPSLLKQSGEQSAPTYTFGWPEGNLTYLQM